MVDVSNSMLSEDTRPSRLEVAKSELTRFVELSAGNRMALVAFAGSAVLLSPMTTDMNALKMYIESLDPDAVSTQGTDFSKALVEAFDAFERGGLGENSDAQVTRAILVISDGEDQEPGLKEAVDKLTKENIHIFTMGVGTEEGGAIPVRDDQGVLRGYKRGKDGQVIMSKTSGTVLKDLAKAGKGSFHHASFQGDAIAAIRSDIEQLKKSQFESGEIRSFDEKFQFLLFLALALGLFEIWLGDRKAVGRIWQGRFEVARD
jgi:Ca-activated chloride channel family protein